MSHSLLKNLGRLRLAGADFVVGEADGAPFGETQQQANGAAVLGKEARFDGLDGLVGVWVHNPDGAVCLFADHSSFLLPGDYPPPASGLLLFG